MFTRIKKILFDIFKKQYTEQGMVQFYEDKPAICGDTLKNLEPITVDEITQKRAHRKIFAEYNRRYPEYKNFIQLW